MSHDPRYLKMSNASPERQRQRLEAKIPADRSGCWVWSGHKLRNGYGQMRVGPGRRDYVHRVSYRIFKGPIPEGLHIDHLCRTRACFNPEHLEVVTPAENVRRGIPYWESRQKPRPTRCGKGHALTDETAYRRKPRGWGCRECDRVHYRARYVPREREPETRCRNGGHEFTPENTIIQASGARTCRECRLASKRRAYAATRSR